jgi:hypothetical protein
LTTFLHRFPAAEVFAARHFAASAMAPPCPPIRLVFRPAPADLTRDGTDGATSGASWFAQTCFPDHAYLLFALDDPPCASLTYPLMMNGWRFTSFFAYYPYSGSGEDDCLRVDS